MSDVNQSRSWPLNTKDKQAEGLTEIFFQTSQDSNAARQNGVPLTFKDLRDPKDYRVGVLRLQDKILEKIRNQQDITSNETQEYIRDYRFMTRYRKTNPAPIQDPAKRHFFNARVEQYDLKRERAQRRRGEYLDDFIAKMTFFALFAEKKPAMQHQPYVHKLMEMISDL
eukprot:UN01711